MHMTEKPCPRMLADRPPRIAAALLVAAASLQYALPLDWLAWRRMPGAGIIIGTLGLLLMLRAWWLFRTANTAICPTGRATSLITTDVYRLTRNPMYLGILLMLTAIAVSVGTVPFAAAAAGFFLVINAVFCPYEETKLETTFGDAYVRYRSRVRRWI